MAETQRTGAGHEETQHLDAGCGEVYPLNDLWADLQRKHSVFQMDHFITAAEGITPWGMYRQSLRQLHSAYRALKDNMLKVDMLKVDVDQLNAGYPPRNNRGIIDVYESQRRKIKLQAAQLELEDSEMMLQEDKREFIRFYMQACKLKAHLGTVDKQRAVELERDFWKAKALQMCAIDYETGHKDLRDATVGLIRALPKDIREEILPLLEKRLELRKAFYDTNGSGLIDAPDEGREQAAMKALEAP